MNRKTLILLSIFVFLILTGLLFLYSCKEKSSNLQNVKVAQFGDVFLYMPLYLAQSEGFFKEQGLNVEISSTGGDDKTYAAVTSGSAQFGVADPTFVAIAKERGQGGEVIASVVNGVPFWGITNDPSVPEIKNSSQLKSYSVATFPSPSTAFTLQSEMFKEAELKPNIRQAAFGTLLPLLYAGKVNIALELEPNVSTALQNGARIVYSMTDKYGDFAITGVMVNDATVKNNPELVQKFVNAIEEAEEFAHKHPNKAIIDAQKKFPDINPVIISNAMERIINSNTLPQNTIITNSAWGKAIKLRQVVGDIKSDTKSTEIANSVLDMSFANKAIALLQNK